jgi:hypothetical protein
MINISTLSTNYQVTSLTANTTYYWQVSATTNGTNSSWITSTFVTAPLPPTSATISPAGDTVIVGGSVIFSATTLATGPFTYQWLLNGNILAQTGQTLLIPAVILANAGSYTVVISNAAGSVISGPAILTVRCAPLSIVTQPVNRTVNMGQTVSFSIIASGTSPLTYQWSGVSDIKGAVNSTYTMVTGYGDNGDGFICRVMDVCGNTVTSNAAILTVKLPPPAPVNLSVQNLTASTVTLMWTAVINADSFNVSISTVNNFSSVIVNARISATSYQVTGLTPGVSYYWRVSAVNAIGTSAYAADSFTTGTAVLATNHTMAPFINVIKSDHSFHISYAGYEKDQIHAELYSVRGEQTALLENTGSLILPRKSCINGIYILRIKTPGKMTTEKIMVQK